MNNEELKKRQVFIPASPLLDRSGRRLSLRRNPNYIAPEDPHKNDTYESFFDFEDELAGLEPSNKQFQNTQEIPKPVEMEESNVVQVQNSIASFKSASGPSGYVILEEIELEKKEKPPKAILKSVELPEPVVNFEFIQCSYLKEDGQRCKRQAPKGKEICTPHQKMIDKEKNQ